MTRTLAEIEEVLDAWDNAQSSAQGCPKHGAHVGILPRCPDCGEWVRQGLAVFEGDRGEETIYLRACGCEGKIDQDIYRHICPECDLFMTKGDRDAMVDEFFRAAPSYGLQGIVDDDDYQGPDEPPWDGGDTACWTRWNS